MRIAVCDDNALFLAELARSIAGILGEQGVSYTLSQFTRGEQLVAAGPFDIAFLDIEMDGMDGMETARRLREQGNPCKLVFLTAHKRYVFAAYDVEAFHYLVKPLDRDKLRQVLLRLVDRLSEQGQRYIAVRQGAALCRLPLGGVLFLEVLDRKVFIHTAGAVYDFYGKLESLEQELPRDFFRCHRSYIVNFSHVRRYSKTEITLANGEVAPISKRKYSAFCKAFLYFLKEGGELL